MQVLINKVFQKIKKVLIKVNKLRNGVTELVRFNCFLTKRQKKMAPGKATSKPVPWMKINEGLIWYFN